MGVKIVILEDNKDRQSVMRACLADRFYTFDVHFFDDARETIRFLDVHLADTLVISLDHDLELKAGPNGRPIDPGTGRDVAEFLAARTPSCPVIVATTNSPAAEAMEEVLRGAGWKTRRVVPFDDMHWIETDWFFAVRRAVVGPVSRSPQPRSCSSPRASSAPLTATSTPSTPSPRASSAPLTAPSSSTPSPPRTTSARC
jgi:CheY-like chemotaxis protein